MRNTKRIIEAIINHTNFNPALKAGLEALYENDVDIIYWNALNEAEDVSVEKKINSAFDKIKPSLKSEIIEPVQVPKYNTWVQKKKTEIESKAKEEVKSKEPEVLKKYTLKDLSKREGDKKIWDEYDKITPYSNLNVEMGVGVVTGKDKYGNLIRTRRREAESANIDAERRMMTAYQNSYYELINAEEKVGVENIRKYMENISDDVQTFVNLVTLLINQIIKEAWVNSPETIKKVYGDNLIPYFETASKAIRSGNVKSFIKESSNLLQLAQDLSVYLLLGDIKKDVNDSLIDIWDEVQTKSQKKIKETPLSTAAKDILFDLGEDIKNGFYKELQDSIWESIPSIIEKHGDNFFLIIESTSGEQYDAFMSSALRQYHPLFETMYEEMVNKKPFNWLLEIEKELHDNKEVENNITYSANILVKQGIASQLDYSFPTIGNSGNFAHKLLQEAYKNEDGLSKLLDVKDSLWITSSYVPGMFGLILLLMNIASGILFVAYAEDMIPFDMSKAHPEFTNLPIWKAFREGSLDIRGKYKETGVEVATNGDDKKASKKTPLRGGLIKKYFVK